jgi:hypothetical protein
MSQGIHPRVRSAFLMLILGTALLLPLAAAAGTTPAGEWVGKVKTPDGDEVEILLNLDNAAGTWTGTLEYPLVGETTVMDLRVTDTRISFTFKVGGTPIPSHFSGSYIAGDDRVTGTFSLRGNSRFVKFNRVPGSEVMPIAPGEEPREPARVRHPYKFAATARFSWWAALHVTKDDYYVINDMTRSTANFDGAVKWFPLDGFNIFARYFRGGHNFTDDPVKLGQYEEIGLSADSYLKLDGFEIGVMGYLGNKIMRNSKFNPYLTGAFGQVDWALQASGRGSETLQEGLYPFEGTDLSAAFGIGTEYEINRRIVLEFEWLWRYFLTEDDKKWDPDLTWSTTHAWSLSAGLTIGI